uniref:DUF2523 domain-containing protein n=1 Tax=Dulem virus 54 TaxID=3145765 RepID=A0AAU8B2Q6_9VIRU
MKFSLATMITSVLMTVAGRLISALGLSFVTYKGMDITQTYFANWLNSQLSSFPAASLQILYIAGVGVCLNWIFGTFTFIVTLKGVGKLGSIVGNK